MLGDPPEDLRFNPNTGRPWPTCPTCGSNDPRVMWRAPCPDAGHLAPVKTTLRLFVEKMARGYRSTWSDGDAAGAFDDACAEARAIIAASPDPD